MIKMHSKFKEGDKVRIRQDGISVDDSNGRYRFIPSMAEMKGNEYTVKKVLSGSKGDPYSYYLEEVPFGWAEEWLEPKNYLDEELFKL